MIPSQLVNPFDHHRSFSGRAVIRKSLPKLPLIAYQQVLIRYSSLITPHDSSLSNTHGRIIYSPLSFSVCSPIWTMIVHPFTLCFFLLFAQVYFAMNQPLYLAFINTIVMIRWLWSLIRKNRFAATILNAIVKILCPTSNYYFYLDS